MSSGATPTEAPGAAADCPRCRKPANLCVCDGIVPVANRVALLILQHPQEQDRALGSARLAALQLKNAVLRIGLSWPSLSKALGRPAEPRRWAVLYLGSAKVGQLARDRDVVALDRKGEAEADQEGALSDIERVGVLDGTSAPPPPLS